MQEPDRQRFESTCERTESDDLSETVASVFGSPEGVAILRKLSRRGSTFSISSSSEEICLEDLEVNPNDIARGEQIATGFSSFVFKASWRGSEVALKELHWNDRVAVKKVEAFRKELLIMLGFRHPNLVLLMGAVTRTLPYSLILEMCCGGTVFELLHHRRLMEVSWRQRMKILLDVAKAMNYLHHCSPVVIHRDLKSLNVLLAEHVADEYDTPVAKVSDFGLSTWAPFTAFGEDPDESCQSLVGTYHWMAPEVIQCKPYNERIDSFAFGVLMFEIASRSVPYEGSGLNPVQLARAVVEGLRPDTTRLDPKCPHPVTSLMLDCWSHNPYDRPSFDIIITRLKSATFSSLIAISVYRKSPIMTSRDNISISM